jgi:hypothetical protein
MNKLIELNQKEVTMVSGGDKINAAINCDKVSGFICYSSCVLYTLGTSAFTEAAKNQGKLNKLIEGVAEIIIGTHAIGLSFILGSVCLGQNRLDPHQD